MKKGKNRHKPSNNTKNGFPPAQSVPENDGPNTCQRAHDSEQSHNQSDGNFDRAMLCWTRVVAVFTAVLAVVAVIQAWAFINSERAFITLDTLDIDKSKFLPVTAKFKNVGKENAFVTAVNVTEWVGASLPTDPPYTKLAMGAGTVLGPSGVSAVILKADGAETEKFMNPDEIAAIQTGKLSLWILGYVQFRDDYSVWGDRVVGFCSRYIPNAPVSEATFDSCVGRDYVYQK